MKIGILSFRGKKYYPNRRLIEAGTKSGHEVVLINPKKCFSEAGKTDLRIFCSSEKVDVLLPRVGAGIDEYTLSLVRQFQVQGILVVGRFDSIIQARNNFLTLQTLANAGISVPDTYYVNNVTNFKYALKALGGYPIVLKVVNSRQGRGVVLVRSRSTAEFLVSTIEGKGIGILAQEYFEPDTRRDIRVFVVGRKCVAALELWPRGNEFRSNYHLNARVKSITLDHDLEHISQRAAEAMGLDICGVDILITEKRGPLVIEVNYSPGFHGLEKATGMDIAGEIINYLEEAYRGDS